MKINSRLLRAAICFQANQDVRYYLNGICISRKYIYATNGTAAIRMEHGKVFRTNVIVRFDHKIPKSAHITRINLLGKRSYAEHTDQYGQIVSMGAIEIIDSSKYPSVDKIIDTAYEKPVGKEFPSIDSDLIKIACKAMNQAGVKLVPLTFKIPESTNDPVLCFTKSKLPNTELGNPLIVLMPMRMRGDDDNSEN